MLQSSGKQSRLYQICAGICNLSPILPWLSNKLRVQRYWVSIKQVSHTETPKQTPFVVYFVVFQQLKNLPQKVPIQFFVHCNASFAIYKLLVKVGSGKQV